MLTHPRTHTYTTSKRAHRAATQGAERHKLAEDLMCDVAPSPPSCAAPAQPTPLRLSCALATAHMRCQPEWLERRAQRGCTSRRRKGGWLPQPRDHGARATVRAAASDGGRCVCPPLAHHHCREHDHYHADTCSSSYSLWIHHYHYHHHQRRHQRRRHHCGYECCRSC